MVPGISEAGSMMKVEKDTVATLLKDVAAEQMARNNSGAVASTLFLDLLSRFSQPPPPHAPFDSTSCPCFDRFSAHSCTTPHGLLICRITCPCLSDAACCLMLFPVHVFRDHSAARAAAAEYVQGGTETST